MSAYAGRLRCMQVSPGGDAMAMVVVLWRNRLARCSFSLCGSCWICKVLGRSLACACTLSSTLSSCAVRALRRAVAEPRGGRVLAVVVEVAYVGPVIV